VMRCVICMLYSKFVLMDYYHVVWGGGQPMTRFTTLTLATMALLTRCETKLNSPSVLGSVSLSPTSAVDASIGFSFSTSRRFPSSTDTLLLAAATGVGSTPALVER
jgi:hypothetical protein